VKLRKLLTKINDSIRPMHVQGVGPSGADPLLDGRVTARSGNLGGLAQGATPAKAPTDWVPSQQDEEEHH
jgi:hypothetical protein